MVSGTNMSDKITDQLKQAEIVQKATKLPSSRAKKNTKKKSQGSIEPNSFIQKCKRNRLKIVGFTAGASALIAIIIAGSLGQYYKDKTLPNISVAGQESGSMSNQALKESLQSRQKALKVSFTVGEKKLQPKEQDIGLKFDTEATVKNAFKAKRQEGFFTRIAFWRQRDVAASLSVNDSLLKQYIESNTPELQKAPTDAQLQFDGASNQFIISQQADGESPDIARAINYTQRCERPVRKTGSCYCCKAGPKNHRRKAPATTSSGKWFGITEYCVARGWADVPSKAG